MAAEFKGRAKKIVNHLLGRTGVAGSCYGACLVGYIPPFEEVAAMTPNGAAS